MQSLPTRSNFSSTARLRFVSSLLASMMLPACWKVPAIADTAAGAVTAQSAPNDRVSLERQADKLHAEAMKALDASNPYSAVEKEQEAIKLTPHYWLPHAALGYIHLGRGGPAIDEADLSVDSEHPVLADINRGLIHQRFRMYEPAIEAFNQALQKDPANLEAKVGIAGCLASQGKIAEAKKTIDQIYASLPAGADVHLLDEIARTYFDCGDLRMTKVVCARALHSTNDQTYIPGLKRLALVAAVNSADAPLIAELRDKVASGLESYEVAWMRTAEFKLAKTPADALTLVRLSETIKTSVPEWIVYSLILQERAKVAAGEKSDWLRMADRCLENAEASSPNNLQDKILLASFDEHHGNSKEALAKITEGWRNTGKDENQRGFSAVDRMQKAELTRLADGFERGGRGYRSYITAVEFTLPEATCHCRYTHQMQMIKPLTGVIDVMIGNGDKPSTVVLFNSRKTSQKVIFESQAVKSSKDKIKILAEKKIETIAQLGDLVEKYQAPLPSPYLVDDRVKLFRPCPVAPLARDASFTSASRPAKSALSSAEREQR